jgi:Protein of unknown function (DUF3489)
LRGRVYGLIATFAERPLFSPEFLQKELDFSWFSSMHGPVSSPPVAGFGRWQRQVPRAANQQETQMTNSKIQIVEKTCEGFTPQAPKAISATKSDKLLGLLRSKRGVTLKQLQEASGWQAHSVRGFLSGTVKTRLGLKLVAETGTDGKRRYRVAG